VETKLPTPPIARVYVHLQEGKLPKCYFEFNQKYGIDPARYIVGSCNQLKNAMIFARDKMGILQLDYHFNRETMGFRGPYIYHCWLNL